jgi:hypothetical protein
VRFYTTLKLGPNREKTPEGFLLCRNVPIARTGTQLYGPGETPISDSSPVKVERKPEQVFRPETIASFNGKPFTIDHPDTDVTPENWNQLTKGIILEPRRGVGIEDDLLLADVLVYDPEAIRLIEDEGMNEVSAGYDAGYEQDEDTGDGYQVDILGNHVALVQAGRCGPRCSIRDCAEEPMKMTTRWKDAIKAAFKANDEKALDGALDQLDKTADESATHIHIHGNDPVAAATDEDPLPEAPDPAPEGEETGITARLDSIERELSNIAARLSALEGGDDEGEETGEEAATGDADPDDDEEEKKKKKEKEKEKEDVEDETSDSARAEATKVGDSRYMEESVQTTMAAAEILTPGITFPTFDRANKPGETVSALTGLRKKSLSIFASTADGGVTLAELRGGKPLSAEALKKMSVKDARTLFFAAAAQVKQRNRDRGSRVELAHPPVAGPVVSSLSEMNRINREFWSKKRPN